MPPNYEFSTFCQIMQMSSAMAWISDATGTRTWFNQSWLTFRGCTSQSEQNSGWRRGLLPTSRDRVLHAISVAAARKSPYCIRYELLCQDGTYWDVNEQAVPLLDDDGIVIGYAGTCFTLSNTVPVDVSQSDATFTVEAGWREGIWCIDLEGSTTYVNSSLASMLGFSESEIIGRTFLDFIEEELHPNALEQLACLRSGKYIPHEFRFRKSNGEPLWVVATPSPLLASDSTVIGIKAIVIDITNRVMTEQRLRDEGLRKNEFISMLAHELRNPLAPIRHALRIIRMQPRLPPQVNDARGIIERETHKMSRYLDDLLDMARISSGRMELRMELSDLTSCVKHAVQSVRDDIVAHSHVLDVTGCDKPISLPLDPVRIEQVLINLLANAIKYTRFHGHIRVCVKRDSEWASVEVSDSGMGIDAEFMPYLFDMYARAHHALSAGVAGAGVGLSLTRKLVELHGGSIEAHSDGLGHGSVFTFRLPLTSNKDVVGQPRDFVNSLDADGSLAGA